MPEGARIHASSRRVVPPIVASFAVAAALLIAAPGRSGAATPSSGTIGPPDGTSVSWTGQTYAVAAVPDPATGGAGCPPAADPLNAVCDHFFLTVNVAPSYWNTHTGGARVAIDWSATGDTDDDFDMYVYQGGVLVDQSGSGGTTSEAVFLEEASGTYEVRVVPFLVTDVRADGVAAFESEDGGQPPNPTRTDGGLRFGPSTIGDLQRTEGEPLNFIHPGPPGPGNSAHWESGPFGTTTQQSWIHRSVDNGDQFNVVSQVGIRPNPPPGGGDTDIVVDDQGMAYWTDLEGLVNLDCSVSNDSGNSWRKNPACVPITPGVDRQWFTLDNGTNHTIGAAGAADNTVFLAFREVLVGVRIYSSAGSTGPTDPTGGLLYTDSSAGTPLPVGSDTTCGQLRFDPVDRFLYYPCIDGNHIRITRGHVDVGQRTGIEYTNVNAPASPGGGPVGDLFPAVATDAGGNVYAVWIDESDHNVYYSASTDHGDTWGPAFQINGNDANSNEFVWAHAGADGRLVVTWLGSPSHADSDNMPSWFNDRIAATQFPWFGYVSVISGAAGPAPGFVQQKFTERPMYYGQICNFGIACSATGGDRTMADYFAFYPDPDTGAARIVYNDVTSQHHGAHLHEIRQLGGPTVLGTTLSQPVPTNPMADRTGDAQVPHYQPGGAGANRPRYDFTNVSVSRVGDDLRVQMTMSNLSSLAPPPGETSGVWLTRFQALSTGEGGEEAYRIFYLGAESLGGGPLSFFAGSGDAASEGGVPGDGCVTRNPEECKVVLYPAEVSATGSRSGSTITVQVPIQGGFGPGRPIKGDTIYNVSGFTFGRSTVPAGSPFTDFLYTEADATRSFDFSLIPQVADLSVVKTDSPDPVHVGQSLTYTVTVTNDGPLVASGVTLTDTLPKNAGFGSVTTTQGSCTVKPAKRLVTCALGSVAAGGTVTVRISVKPTQKGTITNTAQISATSPPDPNSANNGDTETTTVTP
ncbi:MAG: DUF11 domain-containing protein [Actinomycetota bacterium]